MWQPDVTVMGGFIEANRHLQLSQPSIGRPISPPLGDDAARVWRQTLHAAAGG